jgi:hypothetical protein
MRGDINLGDMVSLPQSLVTTTAQAMTNLSGTQNPSNSLTFSGNYLVTDIHHYGNFRQPDAASWNTTLNMVYSPRRWRRKRQLALRLLLSTRPRMPHRR